MRLLDGLAEETRQLILARTRRRRFAKREVIFREGDPADSLHLIDKGRVAVQITSRLGETATINVLGPGRSVGEMALIPPRAPRSATAISLEPAETLELSSELFDQLCREHRETVGVLLTSLAERNRELSVLLVEAHFVPLETRLARRLLELDDHYREDHSASAAIPLTQNDLATLAGTTRESASRVLGRFAESGLISLARGSVTVLDHAGLARRAR